MKTFQKIGILLLLPALLLTVSCRNVEKMVEEGDYDRAIRVSVNKLAGKEKKVKYVKALERSFNRANAGDLNTLNTLNAQGNRNAFYKMIQVSEDVLQRQELVTPLTPLLAENGYQAKFNFIDALEWKNQAQRNYLDASWEEYEDFISSGRNGNSLAARQAYDILMSIRAYENAPELPQLIQEAKRLGTTHVLFKLVLHESSQLDRNTLETIRSFLSTQSIKEPWIEFHYAHQSELTYDGMAELAIQSLFVSPGDAQSSIERVQREVRVGEKAQRDSKGNPVVDTSGNVIMIPVYERVRGEIINVAQYKEAAIEYEIRLIRRGSSTPFEVIRETSVAEFRNAYTDWRGDRRAFRTIPERGYPVPYPPDQQLLNESVRILQANFEEYVLDHERDFIALQ